VPLIAREIENMSLLTIYHDPPSMKSAFIDFSFFLIREKGRKDSQVSFKAVGNN
jgi:hypothetical protein